MHNNAWKTDSYSSFNWYVFLTLPQTVLETNEMLFIQPQRAFPTSSALLYVSVSTALGAGHVLRADVRFAPPQLSELSLCS